MDKNLKLYAIMADFENGDITEEEVEEYIQQLDKENNAAEHSVHFDDANVERHGQTSSDDHVYSDNATGATPHRK